MTGLCSQTDVKDQRHAKMKRPDGVPIIGHRWFIFRFGFEAYFSLFFSSFLFFFSHSSSGLAMGVWGHGIVLTFFLTCLLSVLPFVPLDVFLSFFSSSRTFLFLFLILLLPSSPSRSFSFPSIHRYTTVPPHIAYQ